MISNVVLVECTTTICVVNMKTDSFCANINESEPWADYEVTYGRVSAGPRLKRLWLNFWDKNALDILIHEVAVLGKS